MLIQFAENVYAASYLFGVAITVLFIVGVIGYFSFIALRLRVKTLFWTPAVGDQVRPRRFSKTLGTVEEIKGSTLWVSYWPANSMTKQKQQFERDSLFFDCRPAPRSKV